MWGLKLPGEYEKLLGFDEAMAAGDIQTTLETLSEVMSGGSLRTLLNSR